MTLWAGFTGLTAVLFLLLLGGCSDGEKPFDASIADRDEARAEWQQLEQSESFQDAMVRYDSCMNLAGYPITDLRDPAGILLKDGTRHKPEIGTGIPVKGAYLEYTLDREACEGQSGVADLMQQAGFGPAGPDPTAMNERTVRSMRCMELKGWPVPEPKKLAGGLLIFDVELDAEQRQAYDLDIKTCQNQLFGPGSFQSQPNP